MIIVTLSIVAIVLGYFLFNKTGFHDIRDSRLPKNIDTESLNESYSKGDAFNRSGQLSEHPADVAQNSIAMPSTDPGGVGVESEPIPVNDKPAPSPLGDEVAFVSNKTLSFDIWIAKMIDGATRQLTPWPLSVETEPDWSPDGRFIAFSSSRDSENFNIWTIDVNGTNYHRLTLNVGNNHQPRWSPNGSEFAFISDRDLKNDLWLMGADGSRQRKITNSPFQVNDPSWSPDGRQLVFVGCDSFCNLFTINRDGTSLTQITFGTDENMTPDWGEKGIIFSSGRGGAQGLWIIQPDGSGLTQFMPVTDGGDFDPRWIRSSGDVVFNRTTDTSQVWRSDPNSGQQTQITNVNKFIGDFDNDGDIDQNDINIILAARNTRATGVDDPRDLDGDGMITVLDARKLMLLCSRPRCATQ